MRAMSIKDSRELEQPGSATQEIEVDFVRAINRTIDSIAGNLDRYNELLARLDRKLGEALR